MQDILKKAVKNAAAAIGINIEDLKAFFKRGETVVYKAGDWAFHESTPRQWAGIVLDGEVEIVRGLHGSTARVAVLRTGALISESALLDDLPHSTSAAVRHGAVIWQISRSQLDEFRQTKPEVFYRIVARVAKRMSERLRAGTAKGTDELKAV
ncbi:MAG: cyclic nucleotide-binding domain-containing protein, partial [Desulfobacteraceae bacterium]